MPISHALYLFIALPDPVRAAAAWHRDQPGMVETPVADHRLHMTVGGFGKFDDTPHAGIAWVRARLSRAPLPVFRMYLDVLVRRDRALLLPGEAPAGFARLQRDLAGRLGIDPAWWSRIKPHVTLGYGGSPDTTRAIDPIGWTAERLLLVESLVGESRHVIHASWPLVADARLAA